MTYGILVHRAKVTRGLGLRIVLTLDYLPMEPLQTPPKDLVIETLEGFPSRSDRRSPLISISISGLDSFQTHSIAWIAQRP